MSDAPNAVTPQSSRGARLLRLVRPPHRLRQAIGIVRNATRLDAERKPRPTASRRTARIGAVIADICRDLGIRSNHPLWPELCQLMANTAAA